MPRRDRPRTEKEIAHLEVVRAKRRGDLIPPVNCEECGALGRVEAHHPDYSKPLFVRFVCRKCHQALHGGAFNRGARRKRPASVVESPWRRVVAAAQYLGVSPSAIYKMVQRGQLKAYAIRGTRSLRFKTSDLDASLDVRRGRKQARSR